VNPAAVNPATPLHRTLQQELLAVLRGASLECPVCGEFVLHEDSLVRCPECAMRLHGRLGSAETGVQSGLQAG
jgi:Zn finger protein HypA/HybF involved in hydrogenase expression